MANYESRRTSPNSGNKFYCNTADGGYSPCIRGNYPYNYSSSSRTGYPGLTVLPNCVGYATGRFNEIIGEWKYSIAGDAKTAVSTASSMGLSTGTVPQVGAMICWSGTYGHVAIVESLLDDGGIVVSESGWNINADVSDVFWTRSCSGDSWKSYYGSPFIGFVYNPSVGLPDETVTVTTDVAIDGDGPATTTMASTINYEVDTSKPFTLGEVVEPTQTRTEYTTKKQTQIVTADYDANVTRTRGTSLLVTPTLVESPFVMVRIGEYTFGSYTASGSFDIPNSYADVMYPNYLTGLRVTKINGKVNQYTISMEYQIEAGEDPNFLDKVFSKIGYGLIYITYGDWCAPKFIYREEEALITKLDTNVDFSSSKISYTIYCTSNAISLMSSAGYFPQTVGQPSQMIHDMVYNHSEYGLLDVFTAFRNNEKFFWQCIASDDHSVEIQSKNGMDTLSYLNYLVSCMSPNTTKKDSPIREGNYYMTICEDRELGSYFTIKKVMSGENSISLDTSDVYTVDVGYPGDTLVTKFRLNDNNSWSLLYKYNDDIKSASSKYRYNIDSNGNIYESYSPNIMTSVSKLNTTETQRSWWTQMTQFPVSATLEIKGLLRPAMLMTYVRINAQFYGQRHVSSGLYVITKQEDIIDGNGYRTTLGLLRVAGDLDVLKTQTTDYAITYGSSEDSSYPKGSTTHASNSGNTHGGSSGKF